MIDGPVERKQQVTTVRSSNISEHQTRKTPRDSERDEVKQTSFSVRSSIPVDKDERRSRYLTDSVETRRSRVNGSGARGDDAVVTRSTALTTRRDGDADEEYWEEFNINSSNVGRRELVATTTDAGGLSQAALRVREMYEDGDFDQDVSVSRGNTMHTTRTCYVSSLYGNQLIAGIL